MRPSPTRKKYRRRSPPSFAPSKRAPALRCRCCVAFHSPHPLFFFFFNDPATTEIYTLSLHDALPISHRKPCHARDLIGTPGQRLGLGDRKSTRLNSSHVAISYAVFCLKKKNIHSGRADQRSTTHLQADNGVRGIGYR